MTETNKATELLERYIEWQEAKYPTIKKKTRKHYRGDWKEDVKQMFHVEQKGYE